MAHASARSLWRGNTTDFFFALCDTFSSALEEVIEVCSWSLDDTKLEISTDIPEDRVAAKRDQTGWRDGPAGTLRNSVGINTTSCAWEGRILLQWWRLGSSCAGTAHGCWQWAEQDPALCHGSDNGQQHPGLLLHRLHSWQEHCQEADAGDYSSYIPFFKPHLESSRQLGILHYEKGIDKL